MYYGRGKEEILSRTAFKSRIILSEKIKLAESRYLFIAAVLFAEKRCLLPFSTREGSVESEERCGAN